MAWFILRRLGAALLLLWIVLTATFFLLHLAPGDPFLVYDRPGSSPEQRQNLRRQYGFDEPLVTQYAVWMGAVVRGDWGVSISQQRGTAQVLGETLPNTLLLVLAVLIVEYSVGLPLGVASAARSGTHVDHQVRTWSLVLQSMPVFWFGILLVELLAVRWHLFPIGQMRSDGAGDWPWPRRALDLAHHLVLPALTLGLARSASVVRHVRAGLLDVLQQDYVRTARAIGLGRSRILWVHALKNALGPLIQRFGFTLPGLVSGAVIVEVVFSWPGMGRTTLRAVLERDYPVVLAATGLGGVVVVVSTLVADLLAAAVDPRIRDQ